MTREGPAIVRLQTGNAYEGHVMVDGSSVTIEGHLRVIEGAGDGLRIRLGNRVERSWPTERVIESGRTANPRKATRRALAASLELDEQDLFP